MQHSMKQVFRNLVVVQAAVTNKLTVVPNAQTLSPVAIPLVTIFAADSGRASIEPLMVSTNHIPAKIQRFVSRITRTNNFYYTCVVPNVSDITVSSVSIITGSPDDKLHLIFFTGRLAKERQPLLM